MLETYFQQSIDLYQSIRDDKAILATFDRIVDATFDAIEQGGKILVAGNGGSAADAQHFAAEFVGMYKIERRAHSAIAFTTDNSIMTAIANDYHFDRIFSRQVEALGKKEDILFVLTTSGNSNNLIMALDAAKKIGMKTVAFLGKKGGKAKGLADYEIIIPSDNTPRIQEAQKLILHSIAEEVEKRHYEKYRS
jgi:D-sedoheptulose 7-phosphate isomerase